MLLQCTTHTALYNCIGCPELFDASSVCDITFAHNASAEIDLMDWDISRNKSDKSR